jgi:hypothetical protein
MHDGRSLWVVGLVGLVCGCMRSEAQVPSVFGGKGAQAAQLDEQPLPAGAGTPEPAGPCGRAGPVSETALIDDFEDGDGRLFKGFERDGFWFSASDKTDGSSISPSGSFLPELLAAAESTKENRYAAHLKAAGQTEWGAVWGSALVWARQGIKCPLNVSGFGGIAFRAKGPGKIRVAISVPEVVPKDQGGKCTEGCYDAHGRVFLLSDKWDSYEVRWDKLAQAGWGTDARFTPERVVSLGFNVDTKSLPIEFWIDDVSFIPRAGAAPAH